tara:strand:- start:475 stop:1035 length:561 start_codon:yes stop_codon:yes gene_type:complete
MANYVLFISENKLKDSSAINGNVDNEFLLPYLKIAQRKHIERVLGTDLYNKLQTDIQGGSLSGVYQTLVDDYVQDALVHWGFYEAVPFLRYKVMNNNIVSKQSEDATPLTREEAQDLREEVRNTAEFYTERLIDYICNNSTDYPEYSTNTGADVSPDKTAFYSGLNLDRTRTQRGITLDDFLPPTK